MPPKGKVPTKGAKQILAENATTVNFYRNMALGASMTYNTVCILLYYEQLTLVAMIMNSVVMGIYILCYQTLLYISHPSYTDNSHLVDPGLDLNMEGGMGEHVKDVIILTSITHLLAITSNYFWLLLLFMPLRALWILWANLVGPWFFQEAPVETEMDEKKKKKMERKMNRNYYQHVKDVIILTSITHLLAITSNYFWLLLLFMPLRALWILWANLVGPWFFQEAPVETEMDEKKKKKMERKMNRNYYQ